MAISTTGRPLPALRTRVGRLVRDARQLQDALEEFAGQVQSAQHPQRRAGLLRFL